MKGIGYHEITPERDDAGGIRWWNLAMIYFGCRVTSKFPSRLEAEKYIAGLANLRTWVGR